jgi:diguanylate cyclase (GGDEF)-like protein
MITSGTAAPVRRRAIGIWSGGNAVPDAVYRATRALLRVRTAEQGVGIIISLIKDLGGSTAPERLADSDAIPLDISLGEGEPLLPTAPEGSDARRALTEFLPAIVEDARFALELTRGVERLARDAGVDALTGLPDRRSMGRLMGRLKAGDALVAIDIDAFRMINEADGHDAGDEVLRSFSRALRHVVRAADHFGRMSADEFLVVLQNEDAAAADILLERLREHWTKVRSAPVTFSAGVACVSRDDWRSAMQAAERALFRAKESGRDRWETARDDEYA